MRAAVLLFVTLLGVIAVSSADGAEVAPHGEVAELGELQDSPKKEAKEEAPKKEDATGAKEAAPKKAAPKKAAPKKEAEEEAEEEAPAEAADAAPAAEGAGGLNALAGKANQKAELALTKIKTAKELRSKARAVLTSKGKPIPDILKKGALDDVHQRVMDARSKLHAKFGMSPKNDGELESKVQVKREAAPAPKSIPTALNKADGDYEAEKIKAEAAAKKAKMYKEKYKDAKKKEKMVDSASKTKMQALAQKAAMDKKLAKSQMTGKVQELEVKMREKAAEKLEGPASAENEEDFNHRQIAQEAYNKQVMGYVMTWEKAHGGPVPSKDEQKLKSDLSDFVSGYEQKHAQIQSDIAIADTPTRR